MSSLPIHLSLTKERLSDLKAHTAEILIGCTAVACLIVSAAAISISLDVHAMRLHQIAATAELHSDVSARFDSLLWRFDTLNDTLLLIQKSFSHGLTQVRVEVAQASQDQKKAIQAATRTTEKAVEQTADAIQAAVVTQPVPAPVIHVEAPKAQPPTAPSVIVNPVLPLPAKIQQQRQVEKKSHWRWLRFLWPFHGRKSSA